MSEEEEEGEGETEDKTEHPAENPGDEESNPDPDMNWPFCKLDFAEAGVWSENLCELDLTQDRELE